MLAVINSECMQAVCVHIQTQTLEHLLKVLSRIIMPFFLFLVAEQAKTLDPHSPLQPLNGRLLPLHAVLRPLRLLPLSPLQHHLQLLEN